MYLYRLVYFYSYLCCMTKADKTKQFIIEKTAPVFNRKGYAGTSISDLTGVTGLTKGSIYGNFESKDDVALAAFDYNFSRVTQLVADKVGRYHHSVDKLKAYVAVYAALPADPVLQYGCPVLNTAVEADDTHPALKEKARKAINGWKRALVTLVKEGQERKEIKKSASATAFALSFIALIEGGVMLWKLTGNEEALAAALKTAKRLIKDLEK